MFGEIAHYDSEPFIYTNEDLHTFNPKMSLDIATLIAPN